VTTCVVTVAVFTCDDVCCDGGGGAGPGVVGYHGNQAGLAWLVALTAAHTTLQSSAKTQVNISLSKSCCSTYSQHAVDILGREYYLK